MKKKNSSNEKPKSLTTQGVHLLSMIRMNKHLKFSVWNTKCWAGMLTYKTAQEAAWLNDLWFISFSWKKSGWFLSLSWPHSESSAYPRKTQLPNVFPQLCFPSQQKRDLYPTQRHCIQNPEKSWKKSLCPCAMMFESSSATQRNRQVHNLSKWYYFHLENGCIYAQAQVQELTPALHYKNHVLRRTLGFDWMFFCCCLDILKAFVNNFISFNSGCCNNAAVAVASHLPELMERKTRDKIYQVLWGPGTCQVL